MSGDGPGEGVLGIGVDIHLDRSVGNRPGDVGRLGPGTTVEDQKEGLVARNPRAQRRDPACTDGTGGAALDLSQQVGSEPDHARLVGPMHIAEGEGHHVPTLLAQTQLVDHSQPIVRRGIETLVNCRGVTVLLTADGTHLDFQNSVGGPGILQQFLGDVQVLPQGQGGTVPHVRLEERILSASHLVLFVGEEGTDPLVQVLRGTVIGVKSHGDAGVLVDHLLGESGEGNRTDDPIGKAPPRQVGRPAH